MIVVAINYRTGLMGFLSAQPLVMGNMGLWDQVLALTWIQENIAAFGGDPNSVTLFGESAGGISAGYHLISPFSRNLFLRAIMQSGSAINPISMPDSNYANNIASKVAQLANCSLAPKLVDENKDTVILNVTIECLRKVSANDLLQIQQKILR